MPLRRAQAPKALRAHDERSALEFSHLRLAVGHLTELYAVLANGILELGESEFHLQNLGRESLAGAMLLFRRLPVGKIRERTGRVLDYDVLHAALEAARRGQDALDARPPGLAS